MNVIEKAEKFLVELKKLGVGLSSGDVLKVVSKIANYWEYKPLRVKRKVVLSDDEIKVNEFLLKNGYKAVTVYRWLLLYNSPGEIVDNLRNRRIGMRRAFASKNESFRFMNGSEDRLRVHLQDLIKECIVK